MVGGGTDHAGSFFRPVYRLCYFRESSAIGEVGSTSPAPCGALRNPSDCCAGFALADPSSRGGAQHLGSSRRRSLCAKKKTPTGRVAVGVFSIFRITVLGTRETNCREMTPPRSAFAERSGAIRGYPSQPLRRASVTQTTSSTRYVAGLRVPFERFVTNPREISLCKSFCISARFVMPSSLAPVERLIRYSAGEPSLFVVHWKL